MLYPGWALKGLDPLIINMKNSRPLSTLRWVNQSKTKHQRVNSQTGVGLGALGPLVINHFITPFLTYNSALFLDRAVICVRSVRPRKELFHFHNLRISQTRVKLPCSLACARRTPQRREPGRLEGGAAGLRTTSRRLQKISKITDAATTTNPVCNDSLRRLYLSTAT